MTKPLPSVLAYINVPVRSFRAPPSCSASAPRMYLPEQWPAYYSKAKGCEVWDLDGRRYVDCTMVGIGTSVLGYADPDVEAAVIEAVKAAPMTTLNPPEDVELAELLLELHPWAESGHLHPDRRRNDGQGDPHRSGGDRAATRSPFAAITAGTTGTWR